MILNGGYTAQDTRFFFLQLKVNNLKMLKDINYPSQVQLLQHFVTLVFVLSKKLLYFQNGVLVGIVVQ